MVADMDTKSGQDLGSAVAAVLRAERAASRVTFVDLAERAGMSKETALRMLNGQRTMRFDQFVALSRALGLDPVEVLRLAEARMERK